MKTPKDTINYYISRVCQKYGLDYWIWTPAEVDLTDPAAYQKELQRDEAFYSHCPKLDNVFVPGGDPGSNHPKYLLPFLKKLSEILKKYHPSTGMSVLYLTSFLLGVLGIGLGLAMMSVQSALEAWWKLAGIFSGGMLGLFLLGYLGRNVKSVYAAIGVVCGVILISWMSLGHNVIFHNYLTIVFGTILIFMVGFLLSIFFGKKKDKVLTD